MIKTFSLRYVNNFLVLPTHTVHGIWQAAPNGRAVLTLKLLRGGLTAFAG